MNFDNIAVVDLENFVVVVDGSNLSMKMWSNGDNNKLRHLSMRSIGEIWDSLNYKNNNYFYMCIAGAFVARLDVTESPHFVVVDSYDHFEKLLPHGAFVSSANAEGSKIAVRIASQWF